MPTTTVLLVIASLAFASGGVFMKYSEGLTRVWPSTLVFALFCAGAALQARAMRRAEMGVSYIFVLGLEAVFSFVLAVVVFSEPATATRLIAVTLVVAGIVLLRS